MVEPMRTTVLDRDEDAASYRPLALLAVAAFAVSLIFTIIVVTLTVVGLISRRPVLEPWLIPLAFSGILLAIAARWQIALSEGTREGRRLTNIAWWLSLVGGCIYSSYYFVTVAAIQSQARTFVQEAMFNRLRDRKVEEAFLYTIPPNSRKGMNLTDMYKRFGDVVGPFRVEKLPRLFERANGKVEVKPLGTADWSQKPDGLEVVTRFEIRTPEGTFEAIIPVTGVDDPDTGGRAWYVRRQQIALTASSLTTYGMLLSSLQHEADTFLVEWVHLKRLPDRRSELLLDTLPLTHDQRRQRHREFVLCTQVAPSLAELLNGAGGINVPLQLASQVRRPDAALDLYYRDEIRDFPGRLVRWDESRQAQPAAKKDEARPLVLNQENAQLAMDFAMKGEQRTQIDLDDRQMRISVPMEFTLPVFKYRCQGRAYAVCDDPEVIAELNKRKGDFAGDGDAELVNNILKTKRHEWRVLEVVVDLARDVGDSRPGGSLKSVDIPFSPVQPR